MKKIISIFSFLMFAISAFSQITVTDEYIEYIGINGSTCRAYPCFTFVAFSGVQNISLESDMYNYKPIDVVASGYADSSELNADLLAALESWGCSIDGTPLLNCADCDETNEIDTIVINNVQIIDNTFYIDSISDEFNTYYIVYDLNGNPVDTSSIVPVVIDCCVNDVYSNSFMFGDSIGVETCSVTNLGVYCDTTYYNYYSDPLVSDGDTIGYNNCFQIDGLINCHPELFPESQDSTINIDITDCVFVDAMNPTASEVETCIQSYISDNDIKDCPLVVNIDDGMPCSWIYYVPCKGDPFFINCPIDIDIDANPAIQISSQEVQSPTIEITDNGITYQICEGFENVYITKACNAPVSDYMVREVRISDVDGDGKEELNIISAPEHYTISLANGSATNAPIGVREVGIYPNLTANALIVNNPSSCRSINGLIIWRTSYGLDVTENWSGVLQTLLSENGGTFNLIAQYQKGHINYQNTAPLKRDADSYFNTDSFIRSIPPSGTMVLALQTQIDVKIPAGGPAAWNNTTAGLRFLGSTTN